MSRKSPSDTKFGSSARKLLAENRMTQKELADAMGKSAAYTNHVFTGYRPANAAWVDLVADVMGLPLDKRIELHRAAAKDAGFKLD
jgi:transcriptional regulator with XRE-family HTH domain